MQTTVTTSIRRAAGILRAGGLVAFPTETVYGLGAHAMDEAAVAGIFEAKARPPDNPLIVHVAHRSMIEQLTPDPGDPARRLMDAFFPGPVTLVLPASVAVPRNVTAGLDTVAVRMPDHPTAHALLAEVELPVAAPSANRSGRPSPTTWQAVFEDMNGRIPCILKGRAVRVGLESTVVDCSGRVPKVLRLGAVSCEMLREVCPEIRLAGTGDDTSASPGMKHRHYAPRAQVVLVDHADDVSGADRGDAGFIGLHRPAGRAFARQTVCSSVTMYARRLFSFFRSCDEHRLRVVYCERVSPEGLGRALMDRLVRAEAAHSIPPSGSGTARG